MRIVECGSCHTAQPRTWPKALGILTDTSLTAQVCQCPRAYLYLLQLPLRQSDSDGGYTSRGTSASARIRIVSGKEFEELTVADGPLKKFEFKKGGENFWQERPASTATQQA